MVCKGGTLKSGTDNYYPNAYYKVGDLFLTTRNENPSLRFGGTWELFGKGKTLVCVDENDNDFKIVKQTGGEKKHKLTIEEMPKHNHAGWWRTVNANGNTYVAGLSDAYDGVAGASVASDTGGSQSHNNLQPYITCYIWIRTE